MEIEYNVEQIWQDCLRIIKDNVDPAPFDMLFKSKTVVPLEYKNNTLLLHVPSMFWYDIINEHYINLMQETLRRVTHNENSSFYFRVTVDSINNGSTDIEPTNNNTPKVAGIANQTAAISPFDLVVPQNFDSQLNPTYSFSSFVEGKSNKLARQVGITIAEQSMATAFNPFFIFGSPTVGKTHLAQAVGNATKKHFPQKRILYISASQFRTQFTQAAVEQRVNEFINFYQSLDMLIIDDIQMIKDSEKTQLVFFNIFDHLLKMGKRLIITSDTAPDKLNGMDERLLSRFQWGMRAEIEKPDFTLRKAILMHQVHIDGLEIPEEVVEYIAENVNDNVRNLKGTFLSFFTKSVIMGEPLTIELAKQFIGKDDLIKPTKIITIDQICNIVGNYYSVSKDLMVSTTRRREIVQARQVVIYLSRLHTKSSLKTIGKFLGNRDHATVKYSYSQVENLMCTDKTLKKDIEILSKQITE
ncbi:MAG: chromosomal replication initiator protein DnaA [Bacteroidales bacterium]|nr:chromosomal replication initiator protein DnaA [Bacteroidales bacterium]